MPQHRSRGLASALLGGVLALLLLLVGGPAAAFEVPPIHGHVTDTAGRLAAADVEAIDAHLEQVRRDHGFEVAVLITASLGGEPVADVAYQTFQAWKLGQAGKDNGALLLIAPTERKTFIATGKGVEGALTDLQCSDILRSKVSPALKDGRFRDAVADGTEAIVSALVSQSTAPPAKAAPMTGSDIGWGLLVVVITVAFLGMTGTVVFLVLRAAWLALRRGGRPRREGGSADRPYVASDTSSWSGSSGGSSSSSGSGFTGGGGSSGGGGAGDSY